MRVALTLQRESAMPGPDRRDILRWVRAALEGERRAAVLTVRLVDDEESAALNARWRGRSGPTNVLSFPAEGVEHAEPGLLGDLVLCLPLAHREALAQGKTPAAHCAHLLVHGCLHLLGYDHERDDEARRMEAREVAILSALGLPDPYLQAEPA